MKVPKVWFAAVGLFVCSCVFAETQEDTAATWEACGGSVGPTWAAATRWCV